MTKAVLKLSKTGGYGEVWLIIRCCNLEVAEMNKDEKNALAGMTAKDVARFLTQARDIQEALIKLGIEFIEKTGQGNYGRGSFDYWHFDDTEGYLDGTYVIVYEWYCCGETEEEPYNIPFRVIDDMDGAVAAYFEEKARQEEKAQQDKLVKEQAIAQKKEQEEYEEYLRLKEKFKSQS